MFYLKNFQEVYARMQKKHTQTFKNTQTLLGIYFGRPYVKIPSGPLAVLTWCLLRVIYPHYCTVLYFPSNFRLSV